MKWSGKSVGWLIAGGIICFSAFENSGIADMMSSIALGLVFIAIFVMKQYFDPRGLGWFIAGGVLLAFCIDLLFGIAGGFFSDFSILSGDLSDMFIALLIACGCLYMFYRRNRYAIHDSDGDMDDGDDLSFPYQEEVFKDTDEEANIEVEVTDGEE